MNATAAPWSAVSAAAARLTFSYTDAVVALAVLQLYDGRLLELVGDPENGGYEWVLSRRGQVEAHSDDGYGCADVALRDGLIAAIGLPDNANELAAGAIAAARLAAHSTRGIQ